MKTQIVEDNENNKGQKYPLQEVTGFNQVVIKLQLIFNTRCQNTGITRDASGFSGCLPFT